MSRPVDVLAVMDREIAARHIGPSGHGVGCVENPPGHTFPCNCNTPELTEARAAVAELVEATRALLAEVNRLGWGDSLETKAADAALSKFA